MQCQQLNVILVGRTGSGKSASGNTILGTKDFMSRISATSVTKDITSGNVTIGEVSLTVYDTPGIFDTERTNEEVCHQWNHVLQLDQSSPTVYLLVIRPDRFTVEERKSVQHIETFLGKSRLKNTWILFTRGDELEEECITLEDFIADIPELEKTVQRFEGRYHIFNNKAMGNREQVGRLIEKIQKGNYFTTPSLQVPSLQPAAPHQPSNLPERRLMLLGKTGVGKSASGNTILGRDVFESKMDFKPVTYESKREQSVVAGRQVFVVDTPGLFDTQLTQDEIAVEIGRAVYISSPGVHAFLITLQVNRFTAQEKQVIDLIKELYGEGALKYTVILFTHGDQVEGTDIKQLMEGCKDLSDLVQQCGGGYHVFNNKDRGNTGQVTALLDKIDGMVEENGGSYYTNEMFQDAAWERAREQRANSLHLADAERREREKEEQRERKHQMEIERARKAAEERVWKEYEEDINRVRRENQEMEEERRRKEGGFLRRHWGKLMAAEGIGTGVCAGIGTGIGVVGGPVGMAIGAGVGAFVGTVGTAVGAFVASKSKEDEIPLCEADHLEMEQNLLNE